MKKEIDPITLEVIEGTIDSAITEMEYAVERTARSTLLREQHDYRAAINDRHGRSVSRVSFAATVDCILQKYPIESMKGGEVFLYNDPYLSEGGVGHLPDMCIIQPVVYDGEVIAFVQMFGHCEDVGGLTPGSMVIKATSIFHEGIMVPPIKLYDQGKLNQEAYDIILRNSRAPESLRGDIDAEIAACRIGIRRMIELCQRYGKEVVEAAMTALLGRCSRAIREGVLSLLPNIEKEFEDFIEFDGVVLDQPYKVKVKLMKSPEHITLDLGGSSAQAVGSINWPATDKYYSRIASSLFKGLLPGLVINEGAVEVLKVILPPKGTILNPLFPAPTSNRTRTMLRLGSAVSGVLAKVARKMIAADSNLINTYGIYGQDSEGRPFFFREVLGGGSGGRPSADGLDTVDVVPESKNLPTEFSETMFPVLVERVALWKDSGGAGKNRGGLGYEKDIRMLADGKLALGMDRTRFSCWGVEGGKAGKAGGAIINPGSKEEKIIYGNVDDVVLKKGDLLRIHTAGGGGWGDSLERESQRVKLDVIRGLVSLESAQADYGVIINPSTLEVDESGTKQVREKIKQERNELRLFNRGEYANWLIVNGKITVSDNPSLGK